MCKIQIGLLVIFLLKSYTKADGVLDGFFREQTDQVNSFFQNQIDRVEQAVNSGYEEAVQVKDKVNSYIEDQKKKINDDVNNYIQSVKDTGRNIADSYSFMPTDDPESRLENPELVLSVPSAVSMNGYFFETHTVASQGYILNIHRIPGAKSNRHISQKTVILQHGLFASSADWILNGAQKSLAYVLADAGYDVWMPNIRGNKYSNEHAWYKRDSKQYWNFSWHEVAQFDIPAIIDYILTIKGETKIAYIGHSMGTTILFTMLSLRPEYNQKLTVGLALAPEVFLSNMESPLKSMASVASNVAHAELVYNSYEFVPKNSFFGSLNKMCLGQSVDCDNVIFYLCGKDEEQFNKTLLNPFLSNLGSGTSWKTVLHMSQMILSGRFQQFDYGFERNQRMYGSETPPEYDLSKVTLNITLFWAQNDLLSNELDVRKLHEKLPDSTQMHLVPYPKFNHIDYLWAKEAPRLVNNKVLQILEDTINVDQYTFFLKFG